MKLLSILSTLALVAIAVLPAQAQLNKNSFQKNSNIKYTTDLAKVKNWSDWLPASEHPQNLQIRYSKPGGDLLRVELQNIGGQKLETLVRVQGCEDASTKIVQNFNVVLEAGESKSFEFQNTSCSDDYFSWQYFNTGIWSDWFALNPDNFITARWVAVNNLISVELLNNATPAKYGKCVPKAKFTANFCSEKDKSVNGWKEVRLPQGNVQTVHFQSNTGRCQKPYGGFKLWYKDISADCGVPIFGGK